jgi:tRNA dimethylallyltransferase
MKKVIVLLGPTGVGKTGASICLARELATEIISADSMQIYRGMDIGTAKPSKEERAAVRHHMVDIVDPTDSYSTGRYIRDVLSIIEDLHRRGKTPIVVGGTGLYIKAMTRGLFAGPSSDSALREKLLAMEEEKTGALYAYLSELDPETAQKTEQKDIRRTVRALEVCLKGDEKMSMLQKRLTRPLPYDFIKIGITRNRKELYAMIDRRVDDMLTRGLVGEVRGVLAMNPDRTPLQAIGYKEIASYLRHEIDRGEAVRLIKRNSRRYAKRQFTWFRKEEGIHWVDVTGMYDSRIIAQEMQRALRNTFCLSREDDHGELE